MDPKYQEGQRVKIITLIDGFGRSDPRVKGLVGKTGEVVKYYYASFDEVWEKTLKSADVYCYDVRLDGGRGYCPRHPGGGAGRADILS